MNISTPEKIKSVDFNAKRSNIISSLKRKSLKIADQIKKYATDKKLEDKNFEHMDRLYKNLINCSTFSLYSLDKESEDITYYSSHTCDNKNCPICNYNRQKRIRRKYYKWFDTNKEIVRVANIKTHKEKVITLTQFESKYKNNNKYIHVANEQYDVMHLTLTVPHYKETGFNGNKYYYDEIAKLYWNMRRESFWNDLVYGGEYGIETTNTDNGLNIHIHSLIFVKRFTQSRNILHKEILQYWNKHTVNSQNLRTSFTDNVKASIKKSNKLIDDEYISTLNPMGGTLLTLETIFSWNKDRTEKVRAKEFGSDEMLYAVMEAISYHFEPEAFDKESGEYDLDLLCEILPVIYRKMLYKKFGCLHGEKALNINFNTKLEEMTDDLKESSDIENKDSIFDVDKETGEMKEVRRFFICNPAYIYHFGERDDLKICLSKKARDKIKYLTSQNVFSAIDYMVQAVVSNMKSQCKGKNKYEKMKTNPIN